MKNDVFTGKVVDYTHDGKGVVKYDGIPIFVKDVLINEEVQVKILKWKKKYGFGKLEEIIKPDASRVVPVCPYYQQCGGCQIQIMDYDMQIQFKQNMIKSTYAKQKIFLEEIDFIANDHPFNYRNKLSIPLVKKEGVIKAGLYRENSNDVIGIDVCLIQEEKINDLLQQVVEVLNQYDVSIYDKETLQGLLRQIVIKSSKANKELLLGFVLNSKKYNNQLAGVVEKLINKNKYLKTIVVNFNDSNTNVILGKENQVLYGDGYIVDTINNLDFRISINSFYQVNPSQMLNLYNKAIELGDFNQEDVILDAYCGVGTISSFIASSVKQVVGVDIVHSAIEDANVNKKLNKIDNVSFVCCDVNQYMLENTQVFTKVILDPPRKGATVEFLDSLIAMNLQSIVYIACDVATQARDVKYLLDHGFTLKLVCGVDMFSQTYHTECVVLLEKE